MWIAVYGLGWIAYADLFQQSNSLLARSITTLAAVIYKRLNQLFTNAQKRIKARHGVLKNHCDLVAAHPAQFGLRAMQQITAVKHRSA